MNENLDLTKILKYCPKGWKFYTSVWGEVEFKGFSSESVDFLFQEFRKFWLLLFCISHCLWH